MRFHRVIINGHDSGTAPAKGSALELQHELATETGQFVRVIETVRPQPRPRRERFRDDE